MSSRIEPTWRLRPAVQGDIPAVRHLIETNDLPVAGFELGFGDNYVVAVGRDREIVGVAGIERYDRWGLLRSVAVDPALQRSGIGRSLTADRIEWARTARLEAIFLLTTTAAMYWPRHGFAPIPRDEAPEAVRRSIEWSESCPASATAMRLTL